MRLVIIESPFRGRGEHGKAYARAAMRDCISRGEAPYASHLLLTEVLDDSDHVMRKLGIDIGLAWGAKADLTAVYMDLGISPGMAQGMAQAELEGRPIEHRSIEGSR